MGSSTFNVVLVVVSAENHLQKCILVLIRGLLRYLGPILHDIQFIISVTVSQGPAISLQGSYETKEKGAFLVHSQEKRGILGCVSLHGDLLRGYVSVPHGGF